MYWFCVEAVDFMYEARGTLLVPTWPYFYYWPLIYPDGNHMVNFVRHYIVMEPFYSAVVQKSVFNGHPKFKALVLNIDCTQS